MCEIIDEIQEAQLQLVLRRARQQLAAEKKEEEKPMQAIIAQ